jgi:hypothetical protein
MAERLNATLAGWEDVRITPMFGRWGYFVRGHLFACYPVRPRAHDLWIRLSRPDQARALRMPGLRPHRRFAGRGWVECDVTDLDALGVALRWLRHGWAHVRREAAEREAPPGPDPRG